MDEPAGNSSQSTIGNVAIPDWMLKRRARLQTLAAQNQEPADNPEPSRVDATEILAGAKPTVAAVPAVPAVVSPKPVVASSPKPVVPNKPVPVAPQTQAAQVPATETPATVFSFPEFETSPAVLEPPIVLMPLLEDEAETPPLEVEILVPAIETAEAPELTWEEALRERYLNKKALSSFAISAVTHLVAALMLSLVVFHEQVSTGLSTLLASQEFNGQDDVLDDLPLVQIDSSGGESGDELNKMLSPKAVSTAMGPSTVTVPEQMGGLKLGEGEGAGEQIGNGLNVGGFRMPEGGKFVQKGSFTAWTVPEDPQPGEDYKIIIQVRYKNPKQKISPTDITGSVIGTDKYRLMISRGTSEIIPDANQVVVYIPGAAARVRDKIRVYSATLRENQSLEIVF